jgi:hypothetical protein
MVIRRGDAETQRKRGEEEKKRRSEGAKNEAAASRRPYSSLLCFLAPSLLFFRLCVSAVSTPPL